MNQQQQLPLADPALMLVVGVALEQWGTYGTAKPTVQRLYDLIEQQAATITDLREALARKSRP